MSALDAYRDWWRPEFFAAMKLLAAMSDALAAQQQPRPVLADAAAVEFYSRSVMLAPSVDLLAWDSFPDDPDIEAELPRHGFVAVAGTESEVWTHPSTALPFRLLGTVALPAVARVERFAGGMLAAIGIDVISLEATIGLLVRRWWRSDPAGESALEQAADLLLSWSAAGGDRFAADNYDLDHLDWRLRDATGQACGWPLLEQAVRSRLQGLPMPPRPDAPAEPRQTAIDPVGRALAATLEEAGKVMAARLRQSPGSDRDR